MDEGGNGLDSSMTVDTQQSLIRPLSPWASARLETMNRWAVRIGLPVWFVLIDIGMLLQSFVFAPGDILGIDARIYRRGAAAWLAGRDPWAELAVVRVGSETYPAHYTGLPPTVLVTLPWAVLPEDVVAATWIALAAVAAVWIVRRLGLPWYYLAFPPLVQGVLAANPHVPLLALALIGHPLVAAMAPLHKIYFIVPLIGTRRWRAVVLTLLVFGATVVVAPGLWRSYLERLPMISARILEESLGGYSVWTVAPLVVVVVVALLVIARDDLPTTGWLAVPALWPATQWFYATLALPVITPWMAFLLAADVRGMPGFVVLLVAVLYLLRRTSRTAPVPA